MLRPLSSKNNHGERGLILTSFEHPFELNRDSGGESCRLCGRPRSHRHHVRWPKTWTLHHDPAAVRQARLARRWTQVQLAQEVGISGSYVCEIEAGTRNARPDLLERIATALHCPAARLEGKPNRKGVAA